MTASIGRRTVPREFERTRKGVPWNEVKAWMESWGTPNALSPSEPRKP